jgi:hypothetical protein
MRSSGFTCDGPGYPGQVLTAAQVPEPGQDIEYSISTQSQAGMYLSMDTCHIPSGAQVLFGDDPGACVTNYLVDTLSLNSCDVSCNE